MEFYDIRDLDYTEAAWESLYDAVDATQFLNQDAHVIYDSLKHRLKLRSFGDYLKRYIYQKAGLEGTFTEVPLKDYQSIIKSAFADNHTPLLSPLPPQNSAPCPKTGSLSRPFAVLWCSCWALV